MHAQFASQALDRAWWLIPTLRVGWFRGLHAGTFTLTLSNASGAYIADGVATGTIVNSDPLQKAWLARFGRTVAGQAVDAIGARLEGGGADHVTVGGQALPMSGAAPAGDALEDAEAKARLEDFAKWMGGEAAEESEAGTRSMTGRELLLGSAFQLSAGRGEAGGPAFAAWGRFATGGFDAEEDGVRLSGEVTTGLLGADVAGGRWLAGAAVSMSEGEGPFTLTGEMPSNRRTGTVESTLTAVYPYARLSLDERVDLWGILGRGSGEMTVREDGEESPPTADIAMTMGAVGVRGAVLRASEGGPLDLAVKSDALWVRTTSETVPNLVGVTADVTRLRLILDGSRSFELGGGGMLTPRLEVGVRHDGGDAETGTGFELGAGVRYEGAGVSVEASARTLVAHENSAYEEWGASLGVRIDPGGDGRGLSLSVAPVWGSSGSGSERLWGLRDASALAPDGEAFEAGQRLDAELGYGLAGPGRVGVMTPYAGLGLADGGGRSWRSGVRWKVGSGFSLDFEATRQEAANDDAPVHGAMLRGALRW